MNMNKDERIKELETISLRLFDMVHESNLIKLKIEANELYETIVNNGVLDDVSNCEHDYEHYTNNYGETVAVCGKCLTAYF